MHADQKKSLLSNRYDQSDSCLDLDNIILYNGVKSGSGTIFCNSLRADLKQFCLFNTSLIVFMNFFSFSCSILEKKYAGPDDTLQSMKTFQLGL